MISDICIQTCLEQFKDIEDFWAVDSKPTATAFLNNCLNMDSYNINNIVHYFYLESLYEYDVIIVSGYQY